MHHQRWLKFWQPSRYSLRRTASAIRRRLYNRLYFSLRRLHDQVRQDPRTTTAGSAGNCLAALRRRHNLFQCLFTNHGGAQILPANQRRNPFARPGWPGGYLSRQHGHPAHLCARLHTTCSLRRGSSTPRTGSGRWMPGGISARARFPRCLARARWRPMHSCARLAGAKIAQAEWDGMGPESRSILQAYADGVNAYLKDHNGTSLSLEYAVLGFAQPGLQSPALDSGQQPHLGQGHGLGPARQHGRRDRTRRPAQDAHAAADRPALPALSSGSPGDRQQDRQWHYRRHECDAAKPSSFRQFQPMFWMPCNRTSHCWMALGPPGRWDRLQFLGCFGQAHHNRHADPGKRPASSIQMPSIWYQVDMHCLPKSDQCPL